MAAHEKIETTKRKLLHILRKRKHPRNKVDTEYFN